VLGMERSPRLGLAGVDGQRGLAQPTPAALHALAYDPAQMSLTFR
jgi:hypothetical protein